MKVFLVQLRADQNMLDHEFRYFCRYSGLAESEITLCNGLKQSPTIDDLKSYDALVIGGSGDFLISDNDIPKPREVVEKLLQDARREKIPILGICFGAQIMACAFGGKIELDESMQETGTFEVIRTPESVYCPLLQDLPERFDAHFGHKDHIVEIPKGAVNLASTELSENQMFTFPGESIYALGFHPELDVQAIYDRLDYYAKQYCLTGEAMAKAKASTHDAPLSHLVLKRFFEKVVKGKEYYNYFL